jgi:hypothetical protein
VRGGQEITFAIKAPEIFLGLVDIPDRELLGDVFLLALSITVLTAVVGVREGGREGGREGPEGGGMMRSGHE